EPGEGPESLGFDDGLPPPRPDDGPPPPRGGGLAGARGDLRGAAPRAPDVVPTPNPRGRGLGGQRPGTEDGPPVPRGGLSGQRPVGLAAPSLDGVGIPRAARPQPPAPPDDPEMRELNQREAQLGGQAHELSSQFRSTTIEKRRDELRAELADVVEKQF